MICGSDRTVEAKRVIQLACVVIGTQETRPSLSIKYTGRDAKKVIFSQPFVLPDIPADFDSNLTKVFKADLLQFSRIKNTIFPQLRSFNDSDIPIIVFHDELIPAKQLIEGAHNSFEIKCYLAVQGQIARSSLLSSADCVSEDTTISDEYHFSDHLWIRPRTGDICLGPMGPMLDNVFSLWGAMSQDGPHPELSPLPLSMYSNLTFADPMVKNTSSKFVLDVLSNESTRADPVSIADYDYNHHIWTSSCRQPVAKFAGISWYFNLDCYSEHWVFERPERTTMEDGRIRLSITNHHIMNLLFWFHSERFPTRLNQAWLSQAAHVFNVLGIPRKEWEGYSASSFAESLSTVQRVPLIDHVQPLALFIEDWISLQLNSDTNDTQPISHHPRCVGTQFDPSCYLFVLPPPQLPDTRPDVSAWQQAPAESLYYWSLDPTGDSKMPEAQRIALGLPCFYASTFRKPRLVHWKAEAYDLVRKWQEAKGFDPTTTDFARSMGYPILEISPGDGDRFEDCAEDDEGKLSIPLPNNSRLKGGFSYPYVGRLEVGTNGGR
ncbi:hypothetical protein PM082_016804 [Marasmius tenuissimus]|nr:hypothetical protein PM082_016804 [Marasmius tenuissimus]